MRYHNGRRLFSSQDLKNFTECRFATDLDVLSLDTTIQVPKPSEWNEILFEKGNKFERDYVQTLKGRAAANQTIIEIPSINDLAEQVRLTEEAMKSGADFIFQAALFLQPWHGYADVLRKTQIPSKYGNYSYEVIDIKSRIEPHPDNVVQISLYSFLLGEIQKLIPVQMYIVTGDEKEHCFKYHDYTHYFVSIKSEFEKYVFETEPDIQTVPDPCSFCSLCKWKDHCTARWEATDHVSLVGGVSRRQSVALDLLGIHTVQQLSNLDETREVEGIGAEKLKEICTNAGLFIKRREKTEPLFILKSPEQFRGFDRLPEPSKGDLFFDIEGDPIFPSRRLEYLFGIYDSETEEFVDFWAHSHEEEKEAFEKTIDFMTERLISRPDAFIYHYGSYEETQLKRICAQYATREEEVDEILRSSKLVDLYKTSREAIYTSEPSYSLKDMEVFFAPNRMADVKDAENSMVQYEKWRLAPDENILEGIKEYNLDDCRNTFLLRNWLLSIKPSQSNWLHSEGFSDLNEDDDKHELLASLISAMTKSADDDIKPARELIAQLTQFHRRASKPEWWDFFRRGQMIEEELIESADCIGALKVIKILEPKGRQRSPRVLCKYPEQEHKFRIGADCNIAGVLTSEIEPLDRCGRIEHIDYPKRELTIARSGSDPDLPERFSIVPAPPIPTYMLSNAIHSYCEALLSNTDTHKAVTELFYGRTPLFEGIPIGADIVDSGEMDDSKSNIFDDNVINAIAHLRGSYLVIQGPPGTGKTTLAANSIIDLIKKGLKVGVTSNSHRAIHQLLQKVESEAEATNLTFRGKKKASKDYPDSFFKGDQIENVVKVGDIDIEKLDLIAGTVYLFCHPNFVDLPMDYLFIDEAGQLSLGHLAAMGGAAKNLVLIGDQMQLSQPIKGTHPGDTGQSSLDFILGEHDTIPNELGVFLPLSRRLHPDICNFVSESVYEGRLSSDPSNSHQAIQEDFGSDYTIPKSGIGFVEVRHKGRSQQSEEEGEVIMDLYTRALGNHYTDKEGNIHKITEQNIMVIAPYNAQVNYLKEILPEGAQVGTIDLFQGQEAEIVLISMTTSSKEDLPRNIEFLFSKNRLNVAVTRAKCLSVIVANPMLLTVSCRTIDQLNLVNFLCWLRDYSGELLEGED